MTSDGESRHLQEAAPAPELVRRQLETVLAHPLFNRSQRYTGFLRYVVEQALAEPAGAPKERTIGIEVFGRTPSYDCDADPVVRISAAEVRRRLSTYYADPSHAREWHIELPRGHYRPNFTAPAPVDTPVVTVAPKVKRRRSRWAWAAGAAAALALCGWAVLGMVRPKTPPSASVFEQFWAPALHAPNGAEIAVGDLSDLWHIAGLHGAAPAAVGPDIHWTGVNWEDAHSVASISTVLGPHLRYYSRSSQTSPAAIGSTPTVFIGAFDNSWTLRLTAALPLRFQGGFGKPCCSIVDTQDHGQSYVTTAAHDYAIVARLKTKDRTAERYIVAGIGPDGTLAATALVSDPAKLDQLAAFAPRDWSQQNTELLVRTDFTGGQPGPPVVQRAVFW